MSATGESDTRNYYDMISSRQEIDLRPKLECLDDLVLRSAGLDPAALSFEFRPLWQMDAAASAQIALQKAQATRIYAGLNLWPAAVTARLVEAQLAEDGTYPGAETIFAEAPPTTRPTTDFDPTQPRDPDGRWTNGGGGTGSSSNANPSAGGSQAEAPAASKPQEVSGSPMSPQAADVPYDLSEVIGGLLRALAPIGTASAQEAPTHIAGETQSMSVPTAGPSDAIVRTIAPFVAAALLYLYRSSQGAIQEIIKHFAASTSGGPPPDPNSSGTPTKPGGQNPDDHPAGPDGSPRPLTTHPRQQPQPGPQESSPVSPEPPSSGEGPEPFPHLPRASTQAEKNNRSVQTGSIDPADVFWLQRYADARNSLAAIDPANAELSLLPSDPVPTEADIARVEAAAGTASVKRVLDFLRPGGRPIGERESSSKIREMSGGLAAAQRDYDYLKVGGTPIPLSNGSMVRLPGKVGTIVFRPDTSTPGSPAIDIYIVGIIARKLHY